MKKHLLLITMALSLISPSCSVASLILTKGLEPKIRQSDFQKQRDKMERRVPGITAWVDSLTEAGVMQDYYIVRDGYRLHSYYAPAPRPSRKTAIVVHGYGVNPTNVMMLARIYRDCLGYNIWLPTLRHHGLSEGKAIQMGWFDRLDVIDWAEVAHNHFGDTLQVMHGMSMGAATVMMASGEELPDYIRGFVEDCGYSSLRKEVEWVLKKRLHLPGSRSIVEKADTLCYERYGWRISEVSSTEKLASCSRPMLFIHGGADPLVPVEMAYENYEAKVNGYKEIWIPEGSAHSMSYPDYPEEYTAKIVDFVLNHVEACEE